MYVLARVVSSFLRVVGGRSRGSRARRGSLVSALFLVPWLASSSGLVALTADAYIEEEMYIFFRSDESLVISAGHESVDFYTYESGEIVTDLTLTGGSEPVSIQGTLTVHQAVLAEDDVLVIDASGFSGSRGVVGVSLSTGSTLFQEMGFESVGSLGAVGSDLYFEAITSAGDYRLYRVGSGTLSIEAEELAFLRGDANFDDQVDMSDSVAILDYLFGGGAIACDDAADADDSGEVDVTDAILIQEYLTGSGLSPAPPFPAKGLDTTADGLSCP